MSDVLLSVRGLRRSFYGLTAVDGLDFDVKQGTITGLIGPNGAGKTTAFQCISGVIPPDAGHVSFAGTDITGWSPDRINSCGLIRTFQIARGIPRLTVLENLMLYARQLRGEGLFAAVLGLGRKQEEEALAKAWAITGKLNLRRVANLPAGSLSGGQKKLLEIGRALMADPKMIMLDEPIAGVNPTLSHEIADQILTLRDEGMTFLLIEHHMDIISRLCEPVIVMAEGKKLTEGDFQTIARTDAVQEAYMGRRRWA